MHDDLELLRLYAQDGSAEAFRQLVERRLPLVYAVAFRGTGRNAHLAEEVAQEVFTDLARKAPKLLQHGSVTGWLFVAARFSASKAVRRHRRQQMLREEISAMAHHSPDQVESLDWERIRPLLDDALGRLNDRDREAICLHFFEQKSFAAIGAELHLTESGARMRVERALEKLRQSLNGRGAASTCAAVALALGGQAAAAVPPALGSQVALAALAAPVQSAAALVQLMAITKTQIITASALLLAGAALIGFRQSRALARLESENAQLRHEISAADRRANDLASRLAAAEETKLSDRPGKGSLASSAAQPGSKGPADAVVIHLSRLRKEHPEYAALELRDQKRSVEVQYSKAIQALHLAPDIEAKLKDLLVEKIMAASDAYTAAVNAGIAAGSPESQKAISDASGEVDQQIAALVGSDAAAKLEALRGSSSYGTTPVSNIALDLSYAGQPLSDDQVQSLSLLLHNLGDSNQNAEASSPGFTTPDPGSWLSPKDQQFLARASALVTSEQLAAMKATIAQDNEWKDILHQYTQGRSVPVIITE